MRIRSSWLLVVMAVAGCGADDGPHASGVIAIGEAHGTNGGLPTAQVAIAFAPDANAPGRAPPSCAREVAGCAVALAPDCGGACGAGKRCAFDAGCAPACAPSCDASCAPDEECVLDPTGEPTCRVRARFDAGAITIAGASGQLTLLPPYTFAPDPAGGSLFADGEALSISAVGASLAGYAAFSQHLDATTAVRSDPPLGRLGMVDVFGAADIPVGWIAGDDELAIIATVVAAGGRQTTITCPAHDRDGHVDVPRAAIDAALDGGELDRLVLAIERRRTRVVRGLDTVGALDGQTVQPTGWLELATVSTEIAAFQGCDDGEARCDSVCVDIIDDPDHCGGCGHACPSGDGCTAGVCAGPASCAACGETVSTSGATCADASATCEADAECAALRTCLAGCTGSACTQMCAIDHQAGINLWAAWMECVCGTECAAPCAGEC